MLVLVMMFLLVVGCATGKMWVKPAMDYVYENKVVVNVDKDKVWNQLIRNVAQSFFVINNLDKESGFINLSYSGAAAPYVDCGTMNIEASGPPGVTKYSYSFPYTSPYEAYVTCREVQSNIGLQKQLCPTKRSTSLAGRINILVQGVEGEKTKVSVYVKYVFTVKVQTQWMFGVYNRSHQWDWVASFITNGEDRGCKPTGELERIILDFVGKEV